MTKVHPPVLGFNNNVRHRGRIFHIQTEDSGVRNPRIVTHLFADGGRIIKTARTDYAQHLERADVTNVVRQLMKAQHKAMFTSLRAGELDALLEAACGPLPLPVSRESGSLEPPIDSMRTPPVASAPAALGSAPNPSVPAGDPPSTVRSALEGEAPAPPAEAPSLSPVSSEGAEPLAVKSEAARVRKSSPAASRKPRTPNAPPVTRSDRTTLSRPSSRYGSAPTKTAQSIFGDGVISEKSLDEVILSYLADDLDGSSE